MPTLRTRAAKGSSLTHTEGDTNLKKQVTAKTTTYQVTVADNRDTIECSHATVDFTVTLPTVANAAAAETGDFEVTITNINAATISVDGSGSETIDGSASAIELAQWESITVRLNAAQTGWKSISNYSSGAIAETTGTWTPVVSDGTNDCTTVNQSGTYVKIGSMVYVSLHFTINSTASAVGAARITGLPYTSANTSAQHDFALSVGECDSLITAAADPMVSAQVEANTSYITLHLWDAGATGTTPMTIAEISNGGDMKISGWYEAA